MSEFQSDWRRPELYVWAALLLGAVVVGVTGTASRREASGREVRAAYQNGGSYLPFLVVEDRALLQKRGFTLRLTRYPGDRLEQLLFDFLNNKVDVTAHSGVTLLPLSAAYPGAFAFLYGQFADSYFFLARDTTLSRLSDLEGLTVVTWPSPTAEVLAALAIRNRGSRSNPPAIIATEDWLERLATDSTLVAFAYGRHVVKLQHQGFRVVDQNAVRYVGPGSDDHRSRLFNGGGVIRTQLVVRYPTKARAIRDALFEAMEIIDTEPDYIADLLSRQTGLDEPDARAMPLDEFMWPTEALSESAEQLEIAMHGHGIYNGLQARLANLFWIE